jgi:hypothetical protein
MRNTLITGLLLCLPVAVLLASASLAMLVGKLRRLSSPSARPGTALPYADRVAGRIPGHRHPQATLGVRRGGHLAAGLRDPGQGIVDVLDVNVGNDPGLTGTGRSAMKCPMTWPVPSAKAVLSGRIFQPNTAL